ncbi:MAG TPA: S53 family peptidase [Gemmatimonadaceae bacterium]|jgi:subtilase family serine protease
MSLHAKSFLAIASLATLAACSVDSPTAARSLTAADTSASADRESSFGGRRFHHSRVCDRAPDGEATCHAWIRVEDSGEPFATPGPTGYGPSDLRTAYGLTVAAASNGANQTIAIVDAYDDPNAEADLAVYRSTFGLPACTTANGCFRKVNQRGTKTYPTANAGWAEEISLDVDMASAVCPKCHILLVEATSPSMGNLGAAVNEAVALGATTISNSYGGDEYSGQTTDETHYFNHPGVAITVSSGDNGFGVEFPASSRYVTAVGGTTLTRNTSARGFAESVWSGAGSGCSRLVAKPTWQHDGACARRTVADVAAVADPNTGVAVYDTYRVRPSGWLVFGGTSVAAPVVAGVYALSGNSSAINYGSFSYAHLGSMFDVTGGSNGACGGSYLCAGLSGYDGPSGNGTPNGIGAF